MRYHDPAAKRMLASPKGSQFLKPASSWLLQDPSREPRRSWIRLDGSTAAAEEPQDCQKHDGAYQGQQERADQSHRAVDAQDMSKQSAQDCAHDAYDDVAQNAEAATLDDPTRQGAGNAANDDPAQNANR